MALDSNYWVYSASFLLSGPELEIPSRFRPKKSSYPNPRSAQKSTKTELRQMRLLRQYGELYKTAAEYRLDYVLALNYVENILQKYVR